MNYTEPKTNNKKDNNPKNLLEDMDKELENTLERTSYQSNNEENNQYALECCNKVIEFIANQDGVTPTIVLIGIAEIFQSGGHTRSVTARKANVDGFTLTKKQLVNCMSATRCNTTLRSMARAINKKIAYISYKRKIYGNLFPQYKTYNTQIISADDETILKHAIYCTDFQRDNKDAPEDVLKFLNQREVDKKKIKPSKTKNK